MVARVVIGGVAVLAIALVVGASAIGTACAGERRTVALDLGECHLVTCIDRDGNVTTSSPPVGCR